MASGLEVLVVDPAVGVLVADVEELHVPAICKTVGFRAAGGGQHITGFVPQPAMGALVPRRPMFLTYSYANDVAEKTVDHDDHNSDDGGGRWSSALFDGTGFGLLRTCHRIHGGTASSTLLHASLSCCSAGS